MSKEWYLISPDKQHASGYETDAFNADAEGAFSSISESFIGNPATLYGTKIVNGVSGRCVFQNITSDSANTTHIRQILMGVGSAKGKQYIKDNTTNEYWLVSSLPSSNGIYDKVIAWFCKYSLSFVSPVNNAIVSYPVHEETAALYSVGVSGNNMMQVEDSRRVLYIPCNSETLKISIGMRFLIDKNLHNPTVYKVTEVNTTSFAYGDNGLIKLTLTTTEFNKKTDNPFLMVANYYSDKDTYIVSISNATSPLSLQSGADYTLAATVTKNGASDQTSIWFYSSDESIATVDQAGKITTVANGTCTIYAQVADSVVEIEVRVAAVQSGAVIKTYLPGGDSIIYGQTLRVEFDAYVNGTKTSTTFACSIGGTVLPLATVESTGSNYAVIRAADIEEYVGQAFVFNVSSSALSASVSIPLRVRGWFG